MTESIYLDRPTASVKSYFERLFLHRLIRLSFVLTVHSSGQQKIDSYQLQTVKVLFRNEQ
jgi:hypothetical protein